MVIVLPHITPLCLAGHLPLKGGDRPAARLLAVILGLDPRIHASAFCQPDRINAFRQKKWILGSSPRMTGTEFGEMPGRAEGGAPRIRSTRS